MKLGDGPKLRTRHLDQFCSNCDRRTTTGPTCTACRTTSRTLTDRCLAADRTRAIAAERAEQAATEHNAALQAHRTAGTR